MRSVTPNANPRENFSAILFAVSRYGGVILFSDAICGATRRQRREVDSDFHSSAQLIRRRDIARYSGNATARLSVNFSAIFMTIGVQSYDAAQ